MGHRQKKQVVFIASCGHSGSTILELLLTSDPSCVGIGEAFQLADPKNPIIHKIDRYMCACGEPIVSCEFWKPVIPKLQNRHGRPPEEIYDVILEHAVDTYGPETTIIDSSKAAEAMAALSRVAGVEVKVLHLVRDVRPYCLSIVNANRRGGKGFRLQAGTDGFRGVARILRRNRLYIFWDWYRTNMRLSMSAERLGLTHVTVSYEKLCLDTDLVLNGLTRFLDIQIHPLRMDTPETRNHNVLGNRLRHDPEKRKKIQYDFSWFGRNDWILPSILSSRVMAYNQHTLYRHPDRG